MALSPPPAPLRPSFADRHRLASIESLSEIVAANLCEHREIAEAFEAAMGKDHWVISREEALADAAVVLDIASVRLLQDLKTQGRLKWSDAAEELWQLLNERDDVETRVLRHRISALRSLCAV